MCLDFFEDEQSSKRWVVIVGVFIHPISQIFFCTEPSRGEIHRV